jgi:hypothetical protein
MLDCSNGVQPLSGRRPPNPSLAILGADWTSSKLTLAYACFWPNRDVQFNPARSA